MYYMTDYYDWFCVQWPFVVMAVIIFSVVLFLVVLGLWEGHKATRKIRQQREDLHSKRMSFRHISELPETLPVKGDNALTFEELYHFFGVIYRDSLKIYRDSFEIHKDVNLKPKKGTKRI